MSDLTMVVTTYNRYVFLARLLNYFNSTGSRYPMHILDSSSDTLADPALQNLLEAPGITHTKFGSKISPMQKMFEGLQNVTTPYVAMWADDDFLVPQSVETAKQLLAEREDLSIVYGQCASLVIGSDGVPRTGVYHQRAYLQETAAERLISYLSNYTVTFYSVHRTDALKRNATLTQAQGFGQFWAEVTLGCLAVIQGKAEKLDLLYMIKEAHGAQNTWEDHATEYDVFDRFTDSDFSSSYIGFRDCLAGELVRQDNISISAANEAVKQAFWCYLGQSMSNKWRSKYALGSGMPPSPRERLRRVPGLRRAWGRARGFLPGEANQMTLPALLRPTSPYAKDFKLVYEAVIRDNTQ